MNAYPNSNLLIDICKSFEEQEITILATFMGKNIPISNCNAVGDILEDIFYPSIKEKIQDFEEGPKQASPDFYGMNRQYEFEQKVFTKQPSFDIGNFTSYVNTLCEDGGVEKKLFRTKYLVYEYAIVHNSIRIIKFHHLNVYNMVGYSGKTPITMQIKRNVWYNIRPCGSKQWYSEDKTPRLFIDSIIECIQQCPHIEEKKHKIQSITEQFTALQVNTA